MGRPRTSREVANRILGLAEERYSIRRISRVTGVGRTTISRILKEELEEYLSTPQKKLQKPRLKELEFPNREAKAIRCRGCGVLVYPPCLACQIKERMF